MIDDPIRAHLRERLAEYEKEFGGGMTPFDNAYFAARARGATDAEAQQEGCNALLKYVMEWV